MALGAGVRRQDQEADDAHVQPADAQFTGQPARDMNITST